MISKKNIPRLTISLALLFTTWLYFSQPGQAKPFNYIVAIVNGEIITYSEFERVLKAAELEREASRSITKINTLPLPQEDPNRVGREVLQSLIDQKLQLQEARKIGILVNELEIDRNLEEMKARYGLKNDQEFEAMLARENLTQDLVRAKLKDSMLLFKFQERMIYQKIQISDREITAYCVKHFKEQGNGIWLKHILFSLPEDADEDTIAQVQKKASQVWQGLQKGEDFAKAAATYSDDDETAERGGNLGFFEKKDLSDLFRIEIERLKVGEVSPPVRTPFGFHLLSYSDQDQPVVEKNSAKWKEIEDSLIKEKAEKYLRQYLEELRSRSYFENRLEDLSSCD